MGAFLVVIREVHANETNVLLKQIEADGLRLVSNIIFNLHKSKNLRRCSECLLEIVVELREFAHRIVEFENGDDKSEESAFGKDLVPDLITAYKEQQRDRDGANHVH